MYCLSAVICFIVRCVFTTARQLPPHLRHRKHDWGLLKLAAKGKQKRNRFQMGSERIQLNVHIEQRQRSKKKVALRSDSFGVNEPIVRMSPHL